jgi:CheY-like chemotaxis protein
MIKILLVEDEALNRDMLTRRLEMKGFNVACAEDGLEAVDKAKTEEPDIILMDMNLPGIMGWEAAKRIKADPSTSAIPILGLSAHALQRERDRALENGCDDYETKPVNFNRLLSKIDDHLVKA